MGGTSSPGPDEKHFRSGSQWEADRVGTLKDGTSSRGTDGKHFDLRHTGSGGPTSPDLRE